MKQALPPVIITVVFLAVLLSSAVAVNPHVVLETSSGPIVLELFPDDSPLTVANFLDPKWEDKYLDFKRKPIEVDRLGSQEMYE